MSELTYPLALDLDAGDGPSERARGASGLTELSTMVVRALRLSLRNVDGLITALVLPVMLMVMFVYFFGGAIHVGGRYIDYVVPGVLMVCAGFGAGTTAVTVSADLAGGIVDRFRSLDVRPRSLLAGHVVASVVRSRWPSHSRSGSLRRRRSETGWPPSACWPCSSSRCHGWPPPSGC